MATKMFVMKSFTDYVYVSFPTALLALSAAILFAIEIDSINRSFIVTRGISFYLQVMYIFYFLQTTLKEKLKYLIHFFCLYR